MGTETSKSQRVVGAKSIISGNLTQLNTNSGTAFIAFFITNAVTIDGVLFKDFSSATTYDGVVIADTNAVVRLNHVAFQSNQGSSRGICVSAFKNATVFMDSVTATTNNSNGNGILFGRSDRAALHITNSLIKGNGLSGGNGYVIYSSQNNNITQSLNERLLVNVSNSSFINNGMGIEYSYYGSSSYRNCEFKLKPSGSNTFSISVDSATLDFDSCNLSGEVSNYLIYSSGLKKITLNHTKIFDLTKPSSPYVIYSYNTQLEFSNSTFNDLTGSYVFYMDSQNGKITLNNCQFNGGSASSYYIYASAKTFVSQSSVFKNLSLGSGNYFYADSTYFGKTSFDSTNTNDFFYTQNSKSAVFDSCAITNITQNQPLFYTNFPNKLWVKNSTFRNISQASNNPGAPILFWNYDGTVNSTNNTFDQIKAYGPLINNRKDMTLFGNIFKNIYTDSAIFLNAGKLRVFNSNFVNSTTTSFQNDTIYGSPSNISFKLMNSILYSSTPTIMKVRVNPSIYFDTISYCLSNQSLPGSHMNNYATATYQDLYSSATSPLIQDRGVLPLETSIIPNKDIQGNPRIQFGKIDIGAIEFQNQLPTEIQVSSTAYSSRKITCYPNPAKEVLHLEVDENCSGTIVDLKGEVKMELAFKSGVNSITTEGLTE
ncbi:MAG: hypothetical protein K2Q22_03880, partial [Cytophagales bacterium]|nr:hypothetical protein [Cytophagales bacterium]